MAYLIDTSVWARGNQPTVKERLQDLNAHDLIWTCRGVDLEVLYGARSRDVDRTLRRRRYLNNVPVTEEIMERSVDIASDMAGAGLHRHAKPMDLIIAAAAESADLTVLHYDTDFDHISAITGQNTEWVSPPGSLD